MNGRDDVVARMDRELADAHGVLVDLGSRVARVRTAIVDAGPRSDWHHETMRRHRREWPTLWAALDRLFGEDE